MIRHYLKIAWRSLNENRFRNLFTAMNLALAMIVVSLALYIIIQGKGVIHSLNITDVSRRFPILTR